LTERNWTGRDDNCGHHFDQVPFAQSPLTLTLHWKASRSATPRIVGAYRIDLRALEAAGHIRRVDAQFVILRFQRTGDRIEIASKRSGPALVVGVSPL
jgi:hypothetical protein